MNPRNIFNLAKKVQNFNSITQKAFKRFGGAAAHHDDHHDDHHGHGGHGYEVHLVKDKNLIGNKSFKDDLVAVYGFTDVNDHHHHDETDPYHHLRGVPTLSFERMYFADAYYHDDTHEGLMNEPHGYLTMDDPMDLRPNYEKSALELLFLVSGGAILALMLGYQGLNLANPAESLFSLNTAAEEIEDKIRQIRIDNDKLLQRKAQLEEELASLNN
ncbi:transmembrane protein, putative (macronuclear) [Tetrahymena thermophila SB210]|uniref:Transmembrane protein, putative n=1 Tax=Tetrahymena thermophila (strain SB210) TaxID=312017 RepID=Q22Z32_TETTS|nr:transmembrane protein, putative [Tetrahymena thermophila SB210]7TGH_BM Chain BM, Transmembrane protein, putative [Tetrahymena thermophila]8B6F_BB Chain BB, Transmembrane protein, putative [Tetrahymena thermophila SB210]8BQS_BB Chain BB, Transmembrane protein, putative [Tetrahymena thermophila SB210]8GYM_BM Chain BM, Transmembrane protein, putative [Tetrahymena thermophila SB210]8GYM_bm Chain bm, Transmembrane protein, putative [Tetrahymena thermophila SB210]8GZU_BM Chain BM, Transmembrane |eukprot:XP_001010734.2 transmembrane protein, putative [Tetrahymena thermophila SB210]